MSETNNGLLPGSFCWFELHTSDGPAATEFYKSLFGWEALGIPIGPDDVYTMLKQNGGDVGALHQMHAEEMSNGIPPHWLTYILVESADQSTAKARELGAKILMEPFDVMGAGRMSVVQDPQGAIFAVWQAGDHKGASVMGVPNSFCWGELSTSNTSAALGFYSSLFGWTTKPMDIGDNPYIELFSNGVPIGGMMQLSEQIGDVPSHWLIYFAVANCDATVEKAVALGSSIKLPPQDIPTVGRFSVIQDPQGAVFAVIALGSPQT
jgi:predicted enzyme related to lactoylglutathione lyase